MQQFHRMHGVTELQRVSKQKDALKRQAGTAMGSLMFACSDVTKGAGSKAPPQHFTQHLLPCTTSARCEPFHRCISG